MKCLLSVSLTAAVALVGELALSKLMQAPPLQKGVSVQMATTNSATPVPEADNADAWIVTVRRDGALYFGTDQVTPEGLFDVMKARPRNRIANLYIKADARAPYIDVQRVLEVGRAAFFKQQVLLTSQAGSSTRGEFVPPKGLEVLVGSSADAQSPVVQVLDSGKEKPSVEINNQRVPLTTLPNALSQAFGNRESKTVLVTAGGSLPFSEVVHVIDVCRGTGARVILGTPGL